MPPEWLLLNRLQWASTVLAHIGASARWGEVFRAAVEGPTLALLEPDAPA